MHLTQGQKSPDLNPGDKCGCSLVFATLSDFRPQVCIVHRGMRVRPWVLLSRVTVGVLQMSKQAYVLKK